MKNYFKDKVVWIIGASSGIGEALAFSLKEKEAKLIISSRRKKELERIKSENENIKVLAFDLLNFDDLKNKTQEAFTFFGNIDYVFFNGGTSSRGFIEETKFEVHQKLMNLNYFSYVALTKEILPFFADKNKGHFVITSSIMGKIGTPKRSAYAASKHALHGFFDCLRTEVSKNNIKVTLLLPGHISTNISYNTLMPDGSQKGTSSEIHEKGLSPKEASNQILKAVIKNKKEVYIGKKFNQEHLSLYALRFFPNLLFKILEKKIPD